MSIVVASAALDTTWSEFGAVGFTCSTLATVSDCITEVESKLKRGTLSTTTTPSTNQVLTWLIRAKEELAEVRQFSWRRRYATATLTAGTFRYSLPPDYGGGYVKLRDMTNDHTINLISNHQFDILFPDVSEQTSGQVVVGTIKNMELWLSPPPNGSDVFELEYERTGDDVTATDFSWLPEIERFRCCDFATGEAFGSLNDYDRAQFFYNRWEKGLMKAIRSDGKKRWSQMGYRARSVFQAG